MLAIDSFLPFLLFILRRGGGVRVCMCFLVCLARESTGRLDTWELGLVRGVDSSPFPEIASTYSEINNLSFIFFLIKNPSFMPKLDVVGFTKKSFY